MNLHLANILIYFHKQCSYPLGWSFECKDLTMCVPYRDIPDLNKRVYLCNDASMTTFTRSIQESNDECVYSSICLGKYT